VTIWRLPQGADEGSYLPIHPLPPCAASGHAAAASSAFYGSFAFRIVVDIALRALSPAINDPTTAVLAIDQLHRMLRTVGKRDLRTDQILNKSGKLRVLFRTPNWEDFIHLAFRVPDRGSGNPTPLGGMGSRQ
jgi:hypothetical protein